MTHNKFNFLFFLIYILSMTAIMVWLGIGIAPDRYAFILILGTLFIKRTRRFLIDWLPFLFILISYDFLRGFADNLNPRVHYMELINFDQWMFGQIPTISLQKNFFQEGIIRWYDYLATILYFLHFALPLAFGFILWLKNKHYFKKFTTSILLVSYGAFFTFIIYPASPPWLSSQEGLLPPVTKIMDLTLKSFPERLNLPTIYHNLGPNDVAAVPSLHAAYPLLVLLFLYKFFKKKALFFIPYVLAVWVSIVYLGEHYVVDILIAIVYVIFVFYIPPKLINWRKLFAIKKLSGLSQPALRYLFRQIRDR